MDAGARDKPGLMVAVSAVIVLLFVVLIGGFILYLKRMETEGRTGGQPQRSVLVSGL
jgi:hypothetical protein